MKTFKKEILYPTHDEFCNSYELAYRSALDKLIGYVRYFKIPLQQQLIEEALLDGEPYGTNFYTEDSCISYAFYEEFSQRVHPALESPNKAYLSIIQVEKELKNQGFGRAILADLEQYLKKEGFEYLFLYASSLETDAYDEQLSQWYRNRGYETLDKVLPYQWFVKTL